MHPTLFSIGPITLHSYGLMVAIGLSLAIFMAWRRAPKEGLDPEQLLDLGFWLVAAGLAGGRLLYVLVTWREYAADPIGVLRIWDGGLVFYGAFLGSLAALVVYSRARRQSVFRWLDLCAPYIPLAHGVGRIGCFLAGCCYGAPSDSCTAVALPALGDHVARLPVQLYEAGFNFLLFGGLIGLRRWFKPGSGRLFWTYIAVYALGRFFLEFFRGDEIRGAFFLPWLHTSQLIALAALAVAVAALAIPGLRKKNRIP